MSLVDHKLTHQPRDPNFRAKVEASFARQQAMQTLGISMTALSPGHVEFGMPFAKAFTQQHGYIHAGIITTALDSACGYAALSLMVPEAEVLTVEFKSNFLAPAAGDRFEIVADVKKSGRTITVSEADAFAVTDKGRRLVASMTATLMAIVADR